MTRLERWLLIALLIALTALAARSANGPFTILGGPGDHTTCPAAAAGLTQTCYASDGDFLSVNGAAYFQMGAAGAAGPVGATGPQGVPGATGPQGPAGTVPAGVVLTVNGKPGPNVTLAIQ